MDKRKGIKKERDVEEGGNNLIIKKNNLLIEQRRRKKNKLEKETKENSTGEQSWILEAVDNILDMTQTDFHL